MRAADKMSMNGAAAGVDTTCYYNAQERDFMIPALGRANPRRYGAGGAYLSAERSGFSYATSTSLPSLNTNRGGPWRVCEMGGVLRYGGVTGD